MKFKRKLAILLSAVMCTTLISPVAFAGSSRELTKTAQWINEDEGTAKITLRTAGDPIEINNGADVVVVMDYSGSMGYDAEKICGNTTVTDKDFWGVHHCTKCGATYGSGILYPEWQGTCNAKISLGTTRWKLAKEALGVSLNTIIPNTSSYNNVAFVAFDSKVRNGYTVDSTKNKDTILNLVNNLEQPKAGDGKGTNYEAALKKANQYVDSFKKSSKNKKPVYVIFLSDGAPDSGSAGTSESTTMKKNATVYTVGLSLDSSASNKLKGYATSGSYHNNVTDPSTLSDVFGDISKVINSKVTVTDVINQEVFNIISVGEPTSGKASKSSDGKTVIWTLDNFRPEGDTLEITIQLNSDNMNQYKDFVTNESAGATYVSATGDVENLAVSNTAPSKEKPVINRERGQYNVTYSYMGTIPEGAPAAPATQRVALGTENVAVAAAPGLAGYTFSGWTTDDVTVTGGTFTMPKKSVAFTGTWTEKDKFTVTYNAGSGTGTMTPDTAYVGSELSVKDNGFTAPANYIFDGWKDASGATVEVGSKITQNTILTAQWKALNAEYRVEWYKQTADGKDYEKYHTTTASALIGTPVTVEAGDNDVTGFDLNREKSTLSDESLNQSTVLKVYYDREKYDVEGFLDGTSLGKNSVLFGAASPAIIFDAKEHYHIASVKVNGLPVAFTEGKSYTYPEQANVAGPIRVEVTTAEDSKFAVTYDGNGADSGTVADSESAYAGGKIKTAENQFVKDEYTFKEWNTKPDGTGVAYAENADFTVQDSTTLYAIWVQKEYTVTYDANGGTGTPPTSVKGIKDQEVPLAGGDGLTNRLHYFVGWARNAAEKASENIFKAGDTFKITATETLYAIWHKDSATVRFDVNGGTGTPPGSITKEVEEEVAIPDSGKDMARDGYKLLGWATTSTAVKAEYVKDDPYKLPEGDTTLYAVWEQTRFDVTYYVYKDEISPKDHISHDTSKYTAKADGWKGSVEVVSGSGLNFTNCTTSQKELVALEDLQFGKTAGELVKLYQDNYDTNQGVQLVEGLTIVPFRLVDCGNGDIHVDCKIIPDTSKKFMVSYLPGDQGLFKEQSSDDLIYGDVIPAFTGDLSHNPGYEFDGWKVGDTQTTVSAIEGTVTGNVAYTAQWKAVDTEYTIEWYKQTADGTGYEKYDTTTASALTGTPVKIEAGDNDVTGFDLNREKSTLSDESLNQSTVLKVYYDREKYDVEGFLDGTTLGKNSVLFGATSPAITFDAKEHYHIASVTVNGSSVAFDEGKSYTYPEQINVAGPIKVEVTTEMDQFTITASKSGSGTITSEGAVKVKAGEAAVYAITPAEDSYLEDVKIDGNSVSLDTLNDIINSGVYTFTQVLTDHRIEAIFAAKEVITLTANSSEVVYNGREQSVEGFTGTPEGCRIEGLTVGAKGTDAKEYPVTFTGLETAKIVDIDKVDVTRKYIISTNSDSKLVIKQKDVEITVNEASKNFGEADPQFTGSVKGLVTEGDLGTIAYTRTNGDMDEVGVYERVLTANYKENSNYKVTVVPGDFEIKALDMTDQVKATGFEGVYDGMTHGITLDVPEGSETVFRDHHNDDNSFVDAGTYTVEYTVMKTGYKDVTGSAVVNITKRELTLVAGSASKTYDGSALTTTGYAISAGAVVTGQSITVTVTGSQTAVGSTASAISAVKIEDPEGQDVTSNYAVDTEAGVLTVTSSGGGGHHHNNGNKNDTTEINDEDVPLAGTVELNKKDHFNYVKGYEDGNVRPLNSITREEVATIFYRLLTDTSRDMYFSQDEDFSDVASNRWSLNAIATLANGKILTGYENGTFGASRPITRAEFAAIASRFDTLDQTTDNQFSDISNHWAKSYINSAAKKGWITGYEDGTFRPDQYITRAEAMTLINRVLERRVDAEGLINGYKVFPDNKSNEWYYYQVIEATNNHDYADRANISDMEKWTEILSDKTWNE
ncbi:S-layer homology domain-containing protein [Aminipila luticellarii]|uniref:VWA domain-containing protein n=1 Tax=Aminipila luticellarii TaxID=2507160 RepID=A0A410PT79_9FIRM|nr:S-layer homology domain-containing protein [Aminipila luticellarii]QAT42123.1 VWA domain-containing protein [Aminipila luticellarii]